MNNIKCEMSNVKGQIINIINNIFGKTSSSKKALPVTCYLLPVTCLLFTLLLLPSNIFAQTEEPPADVVPPPVRTLSQDEKKMLDEKTDIKKRTQLSFELMDARLANSEKLLVDNNFKDSLAELGVFHGLLDNALNFLIKSDKGKDKVDKNFKSFEMYLRKQIPRLETIRREMPFKYGYYVQRLMKDVRDARSKAIEPLYGDTVVPPDKPNKP